MVGAGMLKVLLVDDDISVIKCFEKMISWTNLGYDKVFTATNRVSARIRVQQ